MHHQVNACVLAANSKSQVPSVCFRHLLVFMSCVGNLSSMQWPSRSLSAKGRSLPEQVHPWRQLRASEPINSDSRWKRGVGNTIVASFAFLEIFYCFVVHLMFVRHSDTDRHYAHARIFGRCFRVLQLSRVPLYLCSICASSVTIRYEMLF